jgi:hypothetical protein
MRCAGHVALMGQVTNVYSMLLGKSEWKDHSEDLGIDGRIILKRILDNVRKLWTGFIWLRTGTSGGLS